MADHRLHFTPSNRGYPMIIYNGYTYRKDRYDAEKQVSNWRCALKGSKKAASPDCKARLVVLGDLNGSSDYLVVKNAAKIAHHSCGPCNALSRVVMNYMKEALVASDTERKPRDVYDEVSSVVPEPHVVELGKSPSVIERLRQYQVRVSDAPPNPKSRCGFDIPERYSCAFLGSEVRQTLVFDSGSEDADRILVWCDRNTVDSIVASTPEIHISGDGTFEKAPTFWYQQYTILVRHYSGRMIPVIFAVLPNKKKQTYLKFFEVVRDIFGNGINSCIFDFEEAAVYAFKETFPDAEVALCLFHLANNVLARFKELGLTRIVAPDILENRRQAYYNLMSIAFLPPSFAVRAAFGACEHIRGPQIDSFLAYFLETYGPSRTFPPKLWNMQQRAKDGLPRTNNSQEGFHRQWNALFSHGKPTLWKWIAIVHRVMNRLRVELAHLNNGMRPKGRRVYSVSDMQVQRLAFQADSTSEANLSEWFPLARAVLRRVTPAPSPSTNQNSNTQPGESGEAGQTGEVGEDGEEFIISSMDDEDLTCGLHCYLPPFDADQIVIIDTAPVSGDGADSISPSQAAATQEARAEALIPQTINDFGASIDSSEAVADVSKDSVAPSPAEANQDRVGSALQGAPGLPTWIDVPVPPTFLINSIL